MAESRMRRIKVWDLAIRLFHWAIVLLMALLWYTGQVGGLDVDVTLPGGFDLFLPNTDLHMLLGQAVLVLLVFRVLWGVFGSGTARFTNFVRGPRAVFGYLGQLLRGRLPVSTGHNPAGGVMVLVLLGLLAAQTITGLFANDDIFSQGPLAHLVSGDTSAALTSLHRKLFDYLLIAAGFHILAVLYYMIRGENLITPMFSGRKPEALIDPAERGEVKMAPLWLAVLLFVLSLAAVWGLGKL